MADAPSFRISTRSIAASGRLLMSTDTLSLVKPYPYGETRLPLMSTSVLCEPSPRSEIAEMPSVVAEDAEELVSDPELEFAAIVCINCSTFDAPVRAISSRVMICTGNAVSAPIRLMLDPVTSTRSSCCGVCAIAPGAVPTSALASAALTAMLSCVRLNICLS